MVKKIKYIESYKNKLGEAAENPPLNGMFSELERVENVLNMLYTKQIKGKSPVTTQTNKFGATNEVVNPAIREYKAYVKTFGDLISKIESIVRLSPPREKVSEGDDPFLNFCDKKSVK